MDYLKMNKIVLGLLGFSLLMGHASRADDVQIQLTDSVTLRQSKQKSRNAAVLISDTTLPVGAVIEVTQAALDNAQKMDYWDGNQNAQMPFVKGVKVISAPGWSKSDISELNQINQDEGLYVAKPLIENKTHTVKKEPAKRQVWADVPIPMFYRNDVGIHGQSEEPKTKVDQQVKKNEDDMHAAQQAVEKITHANGVVKTTGTNDPHCDLCSKYPIKAFISQGVPAGPLQRALDYFDNHPTQIKNRDYITITDFSKNSTEKRMFVLDMRTGHVDKLLVSQGKGSDAGGGRFSGFSDKDGSHATPGGFHLADYFYSKKHGDTLLLNGQEDGKNTHSAARGIEIHAANYATQAFANANHYLGRSFGCLAIDPNQIQEIIAKLRGKSLVYNSDGN
jgi:hypothetical protein